MFRETLREINRQGTTIVIVEQSINVALQVARRAVYMDKGEIRFDGSVAELMSRPDVVRSVFLAGAVSSSRLSQASSHRFAEVDERESVLDVADLRLHYGGVQVLDGGSFRLLRARVVGS